MNPEKKLKGGTDSELTRFKKMWRDSMSESAREFWRDRFVSQSTQAEIRKELFANLKINLTYDGQLNAFRDWEMDQRRRDLQEERNAENERRLKAEHPEWSKEQVRDALITDAYLEARATGNFALGAKMIREDRGLMQALTEREKFAETMKTDIEKAMSSFYEFIKQYPELVAAYKTFEAQVANATAKK